MVTKKEYKGEIMKTNYPNCNYEISPLFQDSKYKPNNNHKCKFLIILLIIQIYFYLNIFRSTFIDKKTFIKKIQEKFSIDGNVNINDIENELMNKT